MKKSVYRSGGKTFDNPIRKRLVENIAEGVITVNGLSQALGVNRLKLYHHLNALEREGVIRGEFKGSREKTYRIVEDDDEIKPKVRPKRITIIPNDSNRKRITELITEIISVSGGDPLNNSDVIVQVDIHLEREEEYKEQKMKVHAVLMRQEAGS